jgi:hypothetical protein
MCKLKTRNTGNEKWKDNMTTPNVHESSITTVKDIEMVEMSDKNSRVYI